MRNLEVSKELLSEVLNLKVVSHGLLNKLNNSFDITYMPLEDDQYTRSMPINIYEFVFMCKEWVNKQEYWANSGYDNKYYCMLRDMPDNQWFYADTEVEAIFKASEYVLKELMLAHYGEDIKDYRISKPEYIGGLKNRIQINEVTSTAQTTEAILGDYAGHASGYITGDDINYHCPEHGVIIGIMSVLPKTAYQQGLSKLWSKPTYLDYYFPEFANLGEQAIKNSEVYYDSVDGLNNDTFGYIPRYSELKYTNSQVCGDSETNLRIIT